MPIIPFVIEMWMRGGCRDHRDNHQDDGAQALGPRRPAEEHPPHDDRQRADESADIARSGLQPEEVGLGRNDWDDKPDQYQQHRGGDAGPQPERLSSVGSFVFIQIASGAVTSTAISVRCRLRR